MPAYLFLILFVIAAVLNVIGARIDRSKLSMVTKPMLLLLLILYSVFRSLPSQPDWLIFGALVACWLGDILLMLPGDKWFTLGGVSFLTGHVLLTVIFARELDFARLPLAVLIPAALLYAAVAAVVIVRSKTAPKPLRIPLLLYLICNSVTNLFALARLIAGPGLWTALSFAGALLFFLSDCSLFLMQYDTGKKRFFKTYVFVMLTYTSAVCLITVGLLPVA